MTYRDLGLPARRFRAPRSDALLDRGDARAERKRPVDVLSTSGQRSPNAEGNATTTPRLSPRTTRARASDPEQVRASDPRDSSPSSSPTSPGPLPLRVPGQPPPRPASHRGTPDPATCVSREFPSRPPRSRPLPRPGTSSPLDATTPQPHPRTSRAHPTLLPLTPTSPGTRPRALEVRVQLHRIPMLDLCVSGANVAKVSSEPAPGPKMRPGERLSVCGEFIIGRDGRWTPVAADERVPTRCAFDAAAPDGDTRRSATKQ